MFSTVGMTLMLKRRIRSRRCVSGWALSYQLLSQTGSVLVSGSPDWGLGSLRPGCSACLLRKVLAGRDWETTWDALFAAARRRQRSGRPVAAGYPCDRRLFKTLRVSCRRASSSWMGAERSTEIGIDLVACLKGRRRNEYPAPNRGVLGQTGTLLSFKHPPSDALPRPLNRKSCHCVHLRATLPASGRRIVAS